MHDFYFLKYEETTRLFAIFAKHDIEARFVGGCVRDALRGLISDDFDVAVNHDILSVKKVLELDGITCIPTGLKYGSVTALINEKKFEITSLRIDAICFGRDCEVSETTSFELDARRRDFTVNALYLSYAGLLFDYFDGVTDLRNGNIRFIGNPADRLREDYLRIFRYYRFCAKYGDLKNEYQIVISNAVPHIKNVSIERIQKELFLTLMSEYSFEIMRFMVQSGALSPIFDEISMSNLEKLIKIEKENNIKFCLEVKLYLLFNCADLISKLRLNKVQKTKIKEYRNFENESFLYCVYKKGAHFSKEIGVIKTIKFGSDPQMLVDQEKFPTFPVSFHDLPNGINNASKKIVACEKWWVNNNFEKSKAECIEFIGSQSEE
jgi:poly(A) polymerase